MHRAERVRRGSPKAHSGEDSRYPRSNNGDESLLSLAQDGVPRRPVMLHLWHACKSPRTGGENKAQSMGRITSEASDSHLVVSVVSTT